MNANAPIGIFDSGIGGLTVVREVKRLLPNENIIYVGDTARVPYGSRDPVEILKFMHQILHFFAKQKVKMAVFACNTMTTYGFQEAKESYPYLVTAMNSGVREAINGSHNKKIGVIATKGTVNNQMHSKAAEELDKLVKVYAKACPDFVPLIEGGTIAGREIELLAKKYLMFFSEIEIDSLILGCTHYPLIDRVIQNVIGNQVKLVNPANATAKDAIALLRKANQLNTNQEAGSLKMCFSADLDKARKMTNLVLSTNKAEFKLINLEDYC